jgi:hypothetical protein
MLEVTAQIAKIKLLCMFILLSVHSDRTRRTKDSRYYFTVFHYIGKHKTSIAEEKSDFTAIILIITVPCF